MDSFLTERSINVGTRVEFCLAESVHLARKLDRANRSLLPSFLHKRVERIGKGRMISSRDRSVIIIIIGTYVNINYNLLIELEITYRLKNSHLQQSNNHL